MTPIPVTPADVEEATVLLYDCRVTDDEPNRPGFAAARNTIAQLLAERRVAREEYLYAYTKGVEDGRSEELEVCAARLCMHCAAGDLARLDKYECWVHGEDGRTSACDATRLRALGG
jgi:hypothetical protein